MDLFNFNDNSISMTEFKQKIAQEKVNVIDVREDYEVANGMISFAKHIPLGELSGRLSELNKSETYYIICQSGVRSEQATSFLLNNGFKAINVRGGMSSF